MAPNSAINDVSQYVDQFHTFLDRAVTEKASDLYIEPAAEGLQVRLRVDGVLEKVEILDLKARDPILQYLRSQSKSNAKAGADSEKEPASNEIRVHFKVKEEDIDLRVAIFPTVYGEAAALRLLSRQTLLTLKDLGFSEINYSEVMEILANPSGLFLVTGPTGSGKSSSLRAMLLTLDRDKLHIISVEDPVEFEIPGVSQTQVNEAAGTTFAAALRSILRQDPDLIMIGEVRDKETAEMAFRYSLTGHMVLSTLHTNGAVETVTRLADLGVDQKLMASALKGVLAQRLVKRLCQKCKKLQALTPEELQKFGLKEPVKAYVAKGCAACSKRGYKGRVGLYELIIINDEFRSLITNKAPEIRLHEKAIASGMKTLLQDGIEKIEQGLISAEDVLTVLGKT